MAQLTSHMNNQKFATRTHAGLAQRITSALALYRQRRALSQMDAHQLHDLGISRQDALQEAAKPIWDVPHGWRC